MNEKIILTDCDGVLLEWETSFEEWMSSHGYEVKNRNVYEKSKRFGLPVKEKDKLVEFFFNSSRIAFLDAYMDSVEYVTKLGELGYKFHVITSFSSNKHSGELRKLNLERHFGNVFHDYIFLHTGSYKKETLYPFKNLNYFWIEDSVTNAKEGHELGLKSILVETDRTKDIKVPFPKCKTWKEIYQQITD